MTATATVRNELETHILTPEVSRFVSRLSREFEPRRQELLARRRLRQQEIDAGQLPDFLPETASIREKEWKVAPIPHDLLDRRVEITGPVDRKMIINALNSGASVFMADFEDSNSPTWQNNLEGQINVRDAVGGTISYASPQGKRYELGARVAMLLVRPRGWHLDERHVLVDGKPISGAMFDFGLYFFHNAGKTDGKWDWPLLLLAQAGKSPGGASVERYLCLPRVNSTSHGASSALLCLSRPFSLPLRWTKFSMSCVTTLWAELRALGLHFQLH